MWLKYLLPVTLKGGSTEPLEPPLATDMPNSAYTGAKCIAEGALCGVHDLVKVSFGNDGKSFEREAVVDKVGK